MSVSLTPVITTAGLQAVLNASNDGLQAKITQVALGDNGWTPTNAATSLRRERNRVPISNGARIQPTQIHITAVENGSTEYWVREIGFVLDDGTLLAVWSHPTQALAWKAANVDLLLAFDMLLSALPVDSVVVDGTGGVNLAPATNIKEGVVRLATIGEARSGLLSSAVVMTPAGSRAHGDSRYARASHRHPWTEIDGKPLSFPPSSHRHTWSQVDGKPSSYPPSSHRHTWSQIDSKPSTYPPSTHNHDTRYIRPSNFRVTSGFVKTNNRYSKTNWAGFNDWTRNYADISPPFGFTMSHLQGFIASIGIIYFSGDVNGDDNMYLRWRRESNKVRVICNNSENRSSSCINYLAIWRK